MSAQDIFNRSLPVLSEKADFIKAVSQGMNVVFTATTGSGKSTCLPQWLYEELSGKVLVVEPRRVACKSLAGFVASLRGEKVGETVGYRIRFDDCTSEKTSIIYATPGVAVKMMNSIVDDFVAVVIDEFHERPWECDLLAAVLRKQQLSGATGRMKTLVVTSATVDGERLARTLCGTLISGKGTLHPVSVSYDETVSAPTSYELPERVSSAVNNILKQSLENGDILVFLPGMGEINLCRQALMEGGFRQHFDIMVLHSSVDTSALHSMLTEHTGKRRVFLSTNIAETSLTIPGVTTVVDSGLVRIRCHRGGRSGLIVSPVCEDSMAQRTGRAGRLGPGRCVRLWSQTFQAEPVTPPQIERTELLDMTIAALGSGLSAEDITSLPWVTPPPEFALEQSLQLLAEMGAIGADGRITKKGEAINRLPLPVELARLVVGVPRELSGTVCDIVALISTNTNFLLPLEGFHLQRRTAIEEARKELFDEVFDELALKLYCLRYGDGKKHHLSFIHLKTARQCAREIRQFAECDVENPAKDTEPLPEPDAIAAYFAKKWPQSVFILRKRALAKRAQYRGKDRVLPASSEPWSNGDIELNCRPFSRWCHVSSTGKKGKLPVAAIVLDYEWVGGQGLSVRGFGRMLHPCSYDVITQMNLGEKSVSSVSLDEDGRVWGEVTQIYGGVEVSSASELLSSQELRAGLAQLICRGSLFEKALTAVETAVHYTRIVSAWPSGFGKDKFPKHPDDECSALINGAGDFLLHRLNTIGVEEPEDVELLDDAAFNVNLEEVTGLDYFELKQLMDDFPITWSYEGSLFRVEVEPKKRQVTLVSSNKASRKVTSLPHLVIPPFHGFSVYLKKGTQSRKIR